MLKKIDSTITDALIENSPMAIIMLDMSGKVIGWNPAAEHIFGWTKKEVMGKLNPIVPEDKQDEYISLRGQVEEGKPYSGKNLLRKRKDGTLIYINISSALLYDKKGNKIGLVGIAEDITERKKAEAAVKESEKRLKTLIDAIPDAVFFKDTAGRHLIVNSAHEPLFGFTPEMLIGKTVEDFLPTEIAAICRRNDEEVLKTKKSVRYEEHSLDKNGNEQILDTIKVPLYDNSGNAVGLVGIVHDITDRKMVENKLRENQEFLEAIIETAPT